MKKLLTILLLFYTMIAQAQSFNNEWIDYSKTYYKFKVGSSGLYRIPQSALAAINLGSADVSSFQLWRNGEEVAVYTSNQTGALAAGGYIEFWGEVNDGKADQVLYRNPLDHINNSKSLFTDTAAYFLTINPAGNNKRLVPTANTIPAGAVAEPYFIHTAGIYPNESIHLGPYGGAVSEAAISASFEGGEGWTSNEISENQTRALTQTGLFPYTGAGAPQMQISMNVVGNSPNSRTVQAKLNNVEVWNTMLNGFGYLKLSNTLPVTTLNGATENISVANVSTVPNNRIKIGTLEITYPRSFNFGGASNFHFKLPGAAGGKYLEIAGFNNSGTPVLYDLGSGRRYEADASNPALIKIYLQPTIANANVVVMSTAAANIKTISSFEVRNFIDYSAVANQGDYLMITHKAILNGSGGSQPVEEYRAYRSSVAGGGYNAKVYMIDQLTDQFAYGIKGSPLSVRNFLRMARNRFSVTPKGVFIIGHGLKYVSARTNESSPVTERLNLVPTFGSPGSDHLLTAEGASSVPLTPIGRVSAVNGNELSLYLEKIIEYEQKLVASPEISDNRWKKNIAHVVGADEPNLLNELYSSLNLGKQVASDTLYGANVSDFVKSTNTAEQQIKSDQLRTLINSGINLLSYFGHSSAIQLNFPINDPPEYSNGGKYPIFHMMGCNVGDFFAFYEPRLSEISTFSEKFVLAKQRGCIAMLAATSFGYVSQLQLYNREFYDLLARNGYSLTIGELMQKTIQKFFQRTGGEADIFSRAQAEEYLLNGDPAIRLYQSNKPDYAVEDNMVAISPAIISVSDQSFTINAELANLGKAINKDLVVELKRTYPDLTTKVIQRDTIPGIRYTHSIQYQIPIDPINDKGNNKFTISIDAENLIDELFESNNQLTKNIFIYSDNIRPVYPYTNSIINNQSTTLSASTGNPLAETRQYIMEIDTTALFNSPLKISQTKTSAGGVVEFAPGITFKDSTVYYWRVATMPVNQQAYVWSDASFTYVSGSSVGYSQSHYYQLNENSLEGLNYSKSGVFNYDSVDATIAFRNKITPGLGSPLDVLYQLNGIGIQGLYIGSSSGSLSPQENSLRFYIIKDKNLEPFENRDLGATGMYGSYRPIPYGNYTPVATRFFQFDISTAEARKTVMSFLDSIPSRYYVGMTSNQVGTTVLPSIWQGDTAILGSKNSLYHKLKSLGFSKIDQINSVVPYIFFYQKDNAPLAQEVGSNSADLLTVSAKVPTYFATGSMKSPVFTKAKKWKTLEWDGYSLETPSTDEKSFLTVYGSDRNGNESVLISDIPVSKKSVDISSVAPAEIYTGLRLELNTKDTTHRTPYQLKYWRIYGDFVPEGAVAPNLYFNKMDTLDVGQQLDIGVAFKNISPIQFDSLNAKLTIRDKNNNEISFAIPKTRPLSAGDTVKLNTSINTKAFTGKNILFLEFNPVDNYQPEQFSFNNLISKEFYVRKDTISPYMDVTFDGIRILNRDIVSSKPNIQITLSDDAKYLALNNPELVNVQLKYPNGVLKRYQFNSDTLIFTPPGQGGNDEKTATASFKPHLPQDGDYELIVSGKDESGNAAGTIDYRIAFQILNKPMISNLLNYPNPFTSSTAFVFTLTGSEIPQNIRIQILTVTGKIVREITKAELGPLRIGRNITEFKWDGTDQYGQKLGNGVYLYRVLTNLNGRSLDKYSTKDNNTDKYFNKGYGKMVLIR